MDTAEQRKRTAVLVVHGIGSQRAQETVNGVIRAAWFDNDAQDHGGRKLWSHPERLSGVDIDLTVMTTDAIPGSTDKRSADFHEFYWAHLMSETKAVAVLLWLWECVRKGPRLKLGMNKLWWAAAIFLALLNLSVALLILQGIAWFSGVAANPAGMFVTPFLMVLIAVVIAFAFALRYRAGKLIRLLGTGILILGGAILLAFGGIKLSGMLAGEAGTLIANVLLPLGIALVATKFLMGKWGLRAFAIAYALSIVFFLIYVAAAAYDPRLADGHTVSQILRSGHVPWSIVSTWSSLAAWTIIGVYLIINAAFLQPYLGDAGRYFRNSPANVAVRREIRRQAVATLEELHNSGLYDRIIVVAHSLGTVVAYDMLRTYYSRIREEMRFDREFKNVDDGGLDRATLRASGREIVKKMAAQAALPAPTSPADPPPPKAWLVTDFVTLGAALTHAYYLMCQGKPGKPLKDEGELIEDFDHRVRERAFPTCPPQRLDGDGLLAFDHGGRREFHHGGLFGLTRWTNLYFPRAQIFWGDAIGGPLKPLFGKDACIKDGTPPVPGAIVDVGLPLDGLRNGGFFTHTLYWDVEQTNGRDAPHIKCLRLALDLADAGTANDAGNFAGIPGVVIDKEDKGE